MVTRRLSLPLFLSSLLISLPLCCQEQTAGQTAASTAASTSALDLPDSPTPRLQPTDGPSPNAGVEAPNRHGYPTEREESLKELPRDFLHDQKLIWAVLPDQMAHGHHWIPVLLTAGATTGILYADPHVMNYFRSHQKNLSDLNTTFSSGISAGEIAAVPIGLLLAGRLRNDPYEMSTAWLCADAYADSAIPPLVIKAIARRRRPSEAPPLTPFQDEFFKDSWYKGSSFPSGHSAAAFSVATVVAHRYRNHRWAPLLAYGMASVISLSRVTGREHFPSDVFLGGVIGYTTAEYAALRPR
jgi:membrane-associated phospholipid phosphatase